MALKQNKTIMIGTNTGIDIEDVIIKVDSITGNKNGITFTTHMYKGEDILKDCDSKYNFIPSLEPNFIAQAYKYLKTLDEYSDAIDC